MTLEDLYEDLVVNKELPPEDSLAWEIDELFIFRHRLSGEEVEALDRKYLPALYEALKEHYPKLVNFFKRTLESAGVDLSIFQKTPV